MISAGFFLWNIILRSKSRDINQWCCLSYNILRGKRVYIILINNKIEACYFDIKGITWRYVHHRIFLQIGWNLYAKKDTPKNHVRCFTTKALKDFLNYHGFVIVKLYGGGYKSYEEKIFRNLPSISPVIKIICSRSRWERW